MVIITAAITGSSYRAEFVFVLGLLLLSSPAEAGGLRGILPDKIAGGDPLEMITISPAAPPEMITVAAPPEMIAVSPAAPPEMIAVSPAAPPEMIAVSPAAPPEISSHGPSKVFNILTHGAKADGKTDNVEAFMLAWNQACKSPDPVAKLLVPQGTFVTGPVIFQGPCTASKIIDVEVVGTIRATTDISEYSEPQWFAFENISNLKLYGGGTFDAQGPSSWQYNDCHGKSSECQLLPTSIMFTRVNNSAFHGITSLNSKGFHIRVLYCENFKAHDLKIEAPEDSPNTDGVHISQSRFVNVSDSVIGTGDDCVAIGQGTTNVVVSRVTCGPGHGFSIGSLGKYPDEKDVSDIHVKNCTLRKTSYGVRIKTMSASPPSRASNITFEDIIVDGVKNPIIIDQTYGSRGNKPSQVKISNVRYRNIRGTANRTAAVTFLCSSSDPCVGLDLVGIDLVNGVPNVKKKVPPVLCVNAEVTTAATPNPSPILCN